MYYQNRLNKGILVFMLLSLHGLQAMNVRVRFFDEKNGKPEAGVTVMVFETKKFARTDAEGFLNATVPSAGEYTFRILRDTGMQEVKHSLSVEGETVTVYTTRKEKAKVPKGAIMVSGQKEKTVLSRHKVTYEEIKRMPGTMGEALKGLETLPGVVAPPFGGGNIVIRGANPDSNLYLYDNLPIQYPFHFIGLNSVVHNDLIKSIDLYTGAYPAFFANATGGVIEIEAIDKVERPKGQFSMSLFSTNAMYQTPINKGKGYMFAAGRVSYMERTIGELGVVPEGIRMPQYHDTQAKFAYDITPTQQISFISLTAQDGFAINAPSKSKNDPTKDPLRLYAGAQFSTTTGFRTTALRHTWNPGSKLTNILTFMRYDPFSEYSISLGSLKGKGIAHGLYYGARNDLTWSVFKFMKLDLGAEYRALRYFANGSDIRQKDPLNTNPNIYDTVNPAFEEVPVHNKMNTNYYGAYSTVHLQFGGLKIEPGVRYDHIGLTNKSVLGPRGVISYNFARQKTTLYGGGGDYYRFPLDTSFSRDAGNPDLDFEKARKYSGGVEKEISERYSAKTEVFKQEFSNQIVQDPYISTPVGMNPDKYQWLTKPVVANRPLYYSNKGTGWSHGYEVSVKKSNRPGARDWFGWINYTWSQTFRNDNIHIKTEEEKKQVLTADEQRLNGLYNNSKEVIYQYDQTHIVNVVYGWRINDDWQIGTRWQYRTSYPVTPVTGDDGGRFSNPANGQTYWQPVYSDYKNSKRMTPYHRLDIRIDKFLNYDWGYMNMFVEVINVYIRKNEVGESFDNTRPYSSTNPVPSRDFGMLSTGAYNMPLINIGLEARF